MGTELVLAADGKRQNGRWERGSLADTPDSGSKWWDNALAQAGTILDHAPDLAKPVVDGALALDAAYRTASENEEHAKLLASLAADLGALVVLLPGTHGT